MIGNLYMQYGCGWCAPAGWVNFDASPTLRFERIPLIGMFYTKNDARFPETVRYGDIVRGLPLPDLPLPDESCRGIYASHVLEHLSRDDFEKALDETYRLLKPGGIFRLVVPDLARHAQIYLEMLEQGDPQACSWFMQETSLGVSERRRGLLRFATEWLGNSKHLWMWDYNGLEHRLSEHGFVDIRKASFDSSEDPKFAEVETKSRFENAIAVQTRKPNA